MSFFDDVRDNRGEVLNGTNFNLSLLKELQENLPEGYSIGAALAIEVDLLPSIVPLFGAGVEGTQGVFIGPGADVTSFTAGALFADVSLFESGVLIGGLPVEAAIELIIVNSDFDDYKGQSTALEFGNFGGIGISVPTAQIDEIPQIMAEAFSRSETFSEFAEVFLELAPAGSALYPSIGSWGVGAEQQYTFETPDSSGLLELFEFLGAGLLGPSPGAFLANCFLSDTMIDMWPIAWADKPSEMIGEDYKAIQKKIWKKPIQDVKPDDIVVSFDVDGKLRPGVVVNSFENTATHILDFWGTELPPEIRTLT